jgi:hypothetical protein
VIFLFVHISICLSLLAPVLGAGEDFHKRRRYITATGGLPGQTGARVRCARLHWSGGQYTPGEGWYNQTLQTVRQGRLHLGR